MPRQSISKMSQQGDEEGIRDRLPNLMSKRQDDGHRLGLSSAEVSPNRIGPIAMFAGQGGDPLPGLLTDQGASGERARDCRGREPSEFGQVRQTSNLGRLVLHDPGLGRQAAGVKSNRKRKTRDPVGSGSRVRFTARTSGVQEI